MDSEIKIIKDYPECNIPFNTCVGASRFKKDDILKLANYCNVENITSNMTRKQLCEKIYEKKGLELPCKTEKKSKCDKETLENCNKDELKAIAKTEGYNKYYNLGKEDLIKFIKNKRGIKILSSEEEETKDDSEIISSKCNKDTLENCNNKDLIKL